ncbi:hypothetical protein T07_2480 [Trichinella nelsoni]|uniref:Uncharacterized protein n=1 Tax=Trichinella nelsoni TaxID=6336 RepID=A0A0V0SIW9_9BILA|nr:hypothetical protein T07_2480 [Trichinella nelsoni]
MDGKQNLERTTVAWVSPILLSQSTVALISRLLTMTSREPASQCSIVDKCIIISSVKNEDTIPTDNAFNSDQRQESACVKHQPLVVAG